MGKIPVLKPRQVVKILRRLGFIEVRQRGSHKQFRHSSPILLRQIAKDIGLTVDEMLKNR
jgi:hypothetical protein